MHTVGRRLNHNVCVRSVATCTEGRRGCNIKCACGRSPQSCFLALVMTPFEWALAALFLSRESIEQARRVVSCLVSSRVVSRRVAPTRAGPLRRVARIRGARTSPLSHDGCVDRDQGCCVDVSRSCDQPTLTRKQRSWPVPCWWFEPNKPNSHGKWRSRETRTPTQPHGPRSAIVTRTTMVITLPQNAWPTSTLAVRGPPSSPERPWSSHCPRTRALRQPSRVAVRHRHPNDHDHHTAPKLVPHFNPRARLSTIVVARSSRSRRTSFRPTGCTSTRAARLRTS